MCPDLTKRFAGSLHSGVGRTEKLAGGAKDKIVGYTGY